MSKKRKYTTKPFESTGDKSDTFFAVYMSLLESDAFKDLSPRAARLYLYCRAQYYAEKKHPQPDDPTTFTMNQAKWQEKYQLYSAGNKSAFYKDMAELINHGFIRCVTCGAMSREKSVYQLSGKWRQYGEKGFEILPSEKTLAMLRKERKDADAGQTATPCKGEEKK